jgi:hypothetical protein
MLLRRRGFDIYAKEYVVGDWFGPSFPTGSSQDEPV